jgi:WD40 repeat protein
MWATTHLVIPSYSPDGKSLLSAIRWPDSTVKLWDATRGEPLATFRGGHEGDGISAAVVNSDRTVITAGYDGKIIHWTSQREKRILAQFPGPVLHVTLAADGRRLLTANGNGTVYVLRLPRNTGTRPR